MLGIPYQKLWELFVKDCKTMQVSRSALEMINALRKKFTVVLITGNMDSFSRFTAPALNLSNYFDLISVSYEEGKHKTDNDGDLFLEYANKLEVYIGDCILIDDNKKCCDLFTGHGGKAFKVNSVEETEEILGGL
ncbi:MAG: HAD hydrolase-like protein [Candidatus Paceibacterota bacterium]